MKLHTVCIVISECVHAELSVIIEIARALIQILSLRATIRFLLFGY
jgi:hypothetical protein